MKVRVDVTLKEGVFDPQSKAIGKSLESLGFPGVESVKVGRTIELELATNDPNSALEQAKDMAQKLLANSLIEDYRITVV